MNKLNELINDLCPNGVEFIRLGEHIKVLRGKRLTTRDICENGEYPVYHGGIIPIGNYTEKNRNANTTMIINVGASAGTIAYSDVDFWSSDGCFCLEQTELYNNRFLYHLMLTNERLLKSKVRKAGIPTLDNKIIENLLIPVPPLEVQCEIVRILDNFTLLSAELSAELKARQKQYNFYKDNVIIKAKDVKKYKLSEVAQIFDGTHQTPKYTETGVHFISVENINDIYRSKKFISKEDYSNYKIKPKINDVFMTRIGSVGKCSVFDKQENLAYYVSLALIRPNTKILNSYYLKYLIESIVGIKELRKRTLVNAVPIKINKEDIGKILLPIPPLKEQERIVNILNKFDRLCNDISQGLPAEIEARRKQYEYYRDKLLTFKELKKEV